MDIEIKSWLYDVLKAIDEIDSFFIDRPRNFIVFQSDLRTKRAVERNIEIIGEAVNRMLKKDEHFQLSNSRKIVDNRNRIIHGYDSVSDNMTWSIVIRHLPILKAEVESLLKTDFH